MIELLKGLVVAIACLCVGGTFATLTAPMHLPKPPAVERIMHDDGGRLDKYIERFNKLRKDNTLVVLDGQCISACTMVTGIINHDRLCITPHATLVFHSAFFTGEDGEKIFAKDGTEVMWHYFSSDIRSYLSTLNWNADEHNDLIFVEAPALAKFIRPCTSQEFTP